MKVDEYKKGLISKYVRYQSFIFIGFSLLSMKQVFYKREMNYAKTLDTY